MRDLEEIHAELKTMRHRLVEMLVPLQTDEGERLPSEEESLRQTIWSAARELENLVGAAPSGLDLTRDDPEMQQILYEYAMRQYFTPQLLADAGDLFVPRFTAEESDLRVFFQYGRWFVTWLKLEEDMSRPEVERRELMVFEKDEHGSLVVQGV